MSESGVGTKVRVGRFAGCIGQHALASDEVRMLGMKGHEREHVLVRSIRMPDAWIPLEHVEEP